MSYREIDTKTKEMYYSIQPIIDEENTINERFMFWAKMNDLATQNIVIQNMKLA